nr:MAG TPA: hypothetical protein [Caudoviricetes sp.]
MQTTTLHKQIRVAVRSFTTTLYIISTILYIIAITLYMIYERRYFTNLISLYIHN